MALLPPAVIRTADRLSEHAMTAIAMTPDHGPAAIWYDRSTQWSIALGPLKMAGTTTRVRYIGAVGGTPPRSRALMMWATAALVLGGWLSWGFAAQASAQRPRFVTPIIDVVVPEAPKAVAALEDIAPSRPAAASSQKAALAETVGGEADMQNPRNFDKFPAVRRAVDAAFQTGEAQDWAEGPYQGIVVAGLPYPEGGKTCRDTAILLRDGGFDGVTKSTVTCRATPVSSDG